MKRIKQTALVLILALSFTPAIALGSISPPCGRTPQGCPDNTPHGPTVPHVPQYPPGEPGGDPGSPEPHHRISGESAASYSFFNDLLWWFGY